MPPSRATATMPTGRGPSAQSTQENTPAMPGKTNLARLRTAPASNLLVAGPLAEEAEISRSGNLEERSWSGSYCVQLN